MKKIKYRELKDYKFEVAEYFYLQTEFRPSKDIQVFSNGKLVLSLSTSGLLEIFPGYAWDGASGIAINTKNFIRGSLVHDVPYQLMRMGLLPLSQRDKADRLLQKICIEDGMSTFRAWYVYKTVSAFGEKYARPTDKKEKQDEILEAP